MANYVLIHGAWHGGWCYRETARALRGAGHDVFTPTHTGVGERAHQSTENITLETHIRDVCGCIEAEELSDVILCGHSYGGMVITGVADRMPKQIKTLVYLDAFLPEHGQSLNSLLPVAFLLIWLEPALNPSAPGQCQTKTAGSAKTVARPASSSKLTSFDESHGAIKLEICTAVKVALLVEVVVN